MTERGTELPLGEGQKVLVEAEVVFTDGADDTLLVEFVPATDTRKGVNAVVPRSIVHAAEQSNSDTPEVARLKRVIERERTASAIWIERVKAEIESRRAISQSRGPYEWNDDDYFKEFGAALDAIDAAVGRASRDLHVSDLTDCPTTNAEVQRARTEQALPVPQVRALVAQWRKQALHLHATMRVARAAELRQCAEELEGALNGK